tara:strand:- start:9856 stop:10044 length:189 start_codon:yes stop_codon:yes gene_type:complete
MILHKNRKNELLITMKGNRINVETKQDLARKELKSERIDFIENIVAGIFIGVLIMYVIFKSI